MITVSEFSSLFIAFLILCWIVYSIGKSRKPPMLVLNVGEPRDPNRDELDLSELARMVARSSRAYRDANTESQELARINGELITERDALLEENEAQRREIDGLRIQLSRWTERGDA